MAKHGKRHASKITPLQQALKRFKRQHRLTWDAVAEHIGVHEITVIKWSVGRQTPHALSLGAVMQSLTRKPKR